MKSNQKGVSVIIAIFSMLIFATMVLVMVSKTVLENRAGVHQLYNREAFYGAEAFIARGIGALVDDAGGSGNGYQTTSPSTVSYAAASHLDGYLIKYGGNATNSTYACFYTPAGNQYAELTTIVGSSNSLAVNNFQQAINLDGTRIKKVEIAYRVKVSSDSTIIRFRMGSSEGLTLWPTADNKTVSNTSFDNSPSYYEVTTIATTQPSLLNWTNYFSGTNYVGIANYGAGTLQVDYLGLRITTGIDADTESWATGNFVSNPFILDRVQTVNAPPIKIEDEAGKVHLNCAPLIFLTNLLTVQSVSSPATKAQAIVNNRNYRTIEEIINKAGISQSDFNAIKDYVTVHSWINNLVTRPTGQRAPININTASKPVLTALFMPAIADATFASSLADLIIARRATPFTSMFSSFTYGSGLGGDSNCFATFVDALSSATFDGPTKANIKDIADGSECNVGLYTNWSNPYTYNTEACYASSAYLISARAQMRNTGLFTPAHVYLKKIAGFSYDYSLNRTTSTAVTRLPVYYGDPSPQPYWRQIFQ